MSNPLFLFVGRSASGKTTIADLLEKNHGHKQVFSYTTRPPRYEGEVGHIFVSKEEFKKLQGMVSYTFYNGNEYGATSALLDSCSIFVVDVPGVESLLEKYETDRPICIIYFNANVYSRINRMLDRGDCDTHIVSRLLTDEKEDWWDKLDGVVWYNKYILHKDVKAYSVNANGDIQEVLQRVLYYITEESSNDSSN